MSNKVKQNEAPTVKITSNGRAYMSSAEYMRQEKVVSAMKDLEASALFRAICSKQLAKRF